MLTAEEPNGRVARVRISAGMTGTEAEVGEDGLAEVDTTIALPMVVGSIIEGGVLLLGIIAEVVVDEVLPFVEDAEDTEGVATRGGWKVCYTISFESLSGHDCLLSYPNVIKLEQ